MDAVGRSARRVRVAIGWVRSGLADALAMRASGVSVATVTHAAGISSTGDEELDRHLPFDEPYYISSATACAISAAVPAAAVSWPSEQPSCAAPLNMRRIPPVEFTPGTAWQLNGFNATSRLCVVDAILSGTHEPGTSHYELLRAFTDDETLRRATAAAKCATAIVHTNLAIPSWSRKDRMSQIAALLYLRRFRGPLGKPAYLC